MSGPEQHVICLCAQWCGTCRDYRAVFSTLQLAWPHLHWHWVDVEDEADRMGDLDIDNFPTLIVAQINSAAPGTPVDLLFAGPLLPHAQTLSRLLEAIAAGAFQRPQLPAADRSDLQLLVHSVASKTP
jgi:thioredoxin 1